MKSLNSLISKAFAGFATVAAVGTVWLWGNFVGKESNQSIVNSFIYQNEQLANELNQLNQELQAMRLDIPELSENTAPMSQPEFNRRDYFDNQSNRERLILSLRNSGTLFDENLIIKLVSIDFDVPTSARRVSAILSMSGTDSYTVRGIEAGTVFQYEGYQIQLVSTSINQAEFTAEPLSEER